MMSNSHKALYVGVTNDIIRRVKEHKAGEIPGFTQRYCCSNLVYYETFSDVEQAILREKQLKKWSRVKKDAVILAFNPELKDLSEDFVA